MTGHQPAAMARPEVASLAGAIPGKPREVFWERICTPLTGAGRVRWVGTCQVKATSTFSLSAATRWKSKRSSSSQTISGEAAGRPTGGLEFVLYSRAVVAVPSRTPRFEINPNAGPAVAYRMSFDPVPQPSHWFVLDVCIVRVYGLRPAGPPAKEVFAPISRRWILGGLKDSPGGTPVTKRYCTKACRTSIGPGATQRESSYPQRTMPPCGHPPAQEVPVVGSALVLRRGHRPCRLDRTDVRAFVLGVKTRVERVPR